MGRGRRLWRRVSSWQCRLWLTRWPLVEAGLVAPVDLHRIFLYVKLCTDRLRGFDWRWNPFFPHW